MTPVHLGPALDFPKTIWQLNHALERLSSRMRRDLGITAQQRVVVRLIGQTSHMTGGELAVLLHLDPGTISATLRRLEHKRLLVRRRDQADARRATLHLTRKGAALNRPHPVTVEEAVERLFRASSRRDRIVARDVLGRLAQALEDVTQKAPRPPALRTRRGAARLA